MYFTIETDREVSVTGIGILSPGEPHRVTDEELAMFKIYQSVPLVNANFPYFVKVTAVLKEGE